MDLPILSGLYQSINSHLEAGETTEPTFDAPSAGSPDASDDRASNASEQSGQHYAPLLSGQDYSVYVNDGEYPAASTTDGTQLDLSIVKEEFEENSDFEAAQLVGDPDVSDFAAAVLKAERGRGHGDSEDDVITEITDVAPGQVNSLLRELGPSDEFHCQECSTPMGVPAGKVVGSHMLWCKRGDVYWCPVCSQQHKQAEAFNLHTITHCFSGEGQTVFCDSCSKQYLLLDDPIVTRKPRKPRRHVAKRKLIYRSKTRNTRSKAVVPQEDPPHSSASEEQDEPPTKRRVGRPRKADSARQGKASRKAKRHVEAEASSCEICGKSFTRNQSLRIHMRSHTGERPYSCSKCDKTFVTSSHLNSHMHVHIGGRHLKCMICDKTFNLKDSLKRHLLSHTGERPYSCEECGKTYKTSADLRYHRASHGEPKPGLNCPHCPKLFRRRDSLTVHIRSHTGDRPYSCEICKKRFLTSSHVKEHMRVHNTLRDITCPICNMMFARRGAAKKHMANHNEQNQFGCLDCGAILPNMDELKTHMDTHDDRMWKHTCEICGNSFTRRDSLTVHMRIHTGERPFKCKVCPEVFYSSSKLGNHIKSVHEPRSEEELQKRAVVCPLCGKSFIHRGSYYSHMLTHTGQKPHSCEVCKKCFLTNSRLKIHMRVHTGERPYKCDQCDRAFTVSSGLKVHMMQHTGERPYRCYICGKGFIGNCKMQNHMRVHTGEKPYKCPMCDMKFRNKLNRVLHIRSHTGERPYPCKLCPKAFKSLSQLDRHQTVHTGARNYCCSECGDTFTRGSSLRKHERARHGIYRNNGWKSLVDGEETDSEDEDMDDIVEDGVPAEDAHSAAEVVNHADKPGMEEPITATHTDNPGAALPTPSSSMFHFLLGQLQVAITQVNVDQPGTEPPGSTPKAGSSEGNDTASEEAFEDWRKQRDHILLSLTILSNFLTTMNVEILTFVRDNKVVDLLMELLISTDRFISRMAARCLTIWVRATDKDESQAVMVQLLERLRDDSIPARLSLSVLDVFLGILTKERAHQTPTMELALDKKQVIFEMFLGQSLSLAKQYLVNRTEAAPNSEVLAHKFLSIWNKLVKYFLAHRMQQAPDSTQRMEANLLKSVTSHLVNQLADGYMMPECFAKAVNSVSLCLPYGTRLSVNPLSIAAWQGYVANQVLGGVQDSILQRVPLVAGEENFGAVTYVVGRAEDEDVALSSKALRKLVLLILKSVALSLSYKPGDSDVIEMVFPVASLEKLQMSMCPAKSPSDTPYLWLFDLCSEQDDALMEALLCLLDTVLLTRKTSERVSQSNADWAIQHFEPHKLFVHFLHTDASWDESFLLDFIISPETCFLVYFIKYLRYVLNDWSHFCVQCALISQHIDLEDDLNPASSPAVQPHSSSTPAPGSSKSVSGNGTSPVLDRCMAVLIRLRVDIQKAYDKKLVNFNCAPLVRLLERCENMYEQ